MTPPSAESVWATVAAHSACVCDEAVYGDLPCLVHARVAAEVWIAAKGLVCTRTHVIKRQGFVDDKVGGTEYDFVYDETRTLEISEVTQIVSWYGLPLSVRFYQGQWYPRMGLIGFTTLEYALIHTGNFR